MSFHSLKRGSFRSGKGSCAIDRNCEVSGWAIELSPSPIAYIKISRQKTMNNVMTISGVEPVGNERANPLTPPKVRAIIQNQ